MTEGVLRLNGGSRRGEGEGLPRESGGGEEGGSEEGTAGEEAIGDKCGEGNDEEGQGLASGVDAEGLGDGDVAEAMGPGGEEHHGEVVHDAVAGGEEESGEEETGFAANGLADGGFGAAGSRGLGFGEGFGEVAAEPEGGGGEESAEKEGNAPGEVVEGGGAGEGDDESSDGSGEEHAGGGSDVGNGAGESAAALGSGFDEVRDGVDEFAADGKSLKEADEQKEDGGEQTRLMPCGKKADGNGGDAHEGDGEEQDQAASDAVGEVAKDKRSDGTDGEAKGESSIDLKERGGAVVGGKEERGEDGSEESVEAEVVPLEDVAEGAGEDDAGCVPGAWGGAGGHGKQGIRRRDGRVSSGGYGTIGWTNNSMDEELHGRSFVGPGGGPEPVRECLCTGAEAGAAGVGIVWRVQ